MNLYRLTTAAIVALSLAALPNEILSAEIPVTATSTGTNSVLLSTPQGFRVIGLSPNGQWACGVYIDGTNTTYGFRWNLSSGSIQILGAEPSAALDVADDGTVSGNFIDRYALPNGAPSDMPGFWRNGSWHSVEMPKGTLLDGMGYGISPDGRYMTGSVCVDGIYKAYIWEDGRLHRELASPNHSVGMCVSPDGQAAAGFTTQRNRTVCYWAPDGSVRLFEDSPSYSQTPWSYARNFSPDGTKLLYWGGWIEEGDDVFLPYMYDFAAGKVHRVQAISRESDLELYDVSDSGLAVGFESGRGYVVKDDKGMFIDEYLASRGVDVSAFEDFYRGADYYQGVLPISSVQAVSSDDKVLVMSYYNTIGQEASLCVRIDPDMEHPMPAEVTAVQLPGLSTVALNWYAPAGANNVRGYYVYRDGRRLTTLPINALSYFDRNLAPGSYTYEVSALTTQGTETRAAAINVVIDTAEPQAPYDLALRQRGVHSARLSWRPALSDMVHRRYFDLAATDLDEFQVYQAIDMETAISFPAQEMACYAGYVLSEVSFVPLAAQNSWAVNVYTRRSDGSLDRLYSQPIDQPLSYGSLNTVALKQPVAVPQGELIVAIEVSTNGQSQLTVGAEVGTVVPGRSDMLRLVSDPDFLSAYQSSLESGLYINCMAWAIDLGLRPAGANPGEVTGYDIYVDGEPSGDTNGCHWTSGALADGIHAFEVEAVYADGRTAPRLSGILDIKASWPGVSAPDVELGNPGSSSMKVTWAEPVDNDRQTVSYTTAVRHYRGIRGNESTSWALMAAHEYPATMMRGFDGYIITDLGFYPLSDALYTLMLYCNGTKVAEIEADDLTFGKWNYLKLSEPVVIDETATYRLVVDCFDPEPDTDVLAIDDMAPFPYLSDLYSADNGAYWSSLSNDTGTSGSWMIGMKIQSPMGEVLDVDGYDVVLDFRKLNSATVQGTSFEADLADVREGQHSVRIDTYYPAATEPVHGQSVSINVATGGVADIAMGPLTLELSDGILTACAEGVQSVAVYSLAGAELARAEADSVAVDALPAGVYIVSVQTAYGLSTRKINIR